ncbi:MAG: lasso RiPP family leader peptide-containing protein [Nitrospira sp. CG24A]|nr:MAG: lasso RiPP family leader peptide-containing protein [Nitrospira sp. CG24A]
MTRETEPDPEKTPPKKPYTTPTLVEYGDIAKLTQGGGGSVPDGMSGMAASMMMMCL